MALSPEPFHVTSTLLALGRIVRARQGELLQEHGLHAGQDAFLMEVWRDPGLNQAMLAERLGIESPTVTRMVARLERVGWVERRRDPDDARATLIYPTPRSRLLELAVRRVWEELAAELTRDFSAEELTRFITLAERMAPPMPR